MKSIRIKSLIVPFITVLTIFGLTMVLLAPQLKQIGNLRKINKGYVKTLSLLTTKLSQLEGIDKNEQKIKAEKIISILPAEQDIPSALVISRELTRETGLVIKKMTVETGSISTSSAKSTINTAIPSFSITITAETELDKVLPFLERVETVSPILGLEKISFSSRGQGLIEISYVLNNYFLDYPVNIGAPETPLPQITAQEDNSYQSIVQNLRPLASIEATPLVEEPGQMGKPNPFIP